MADNVELILQGLRQAGSGFRSAGEGIAAGQESAARREEAAGRKKAAEDIANDRLGISKDLTALTNASQSEDFDQASFVASSLPIRQKIIASGQMELLPALNSIEELAQNRSKKDLKELDRKPPKVDPGLTVKDTSKAAQSAGDKLFTATAGYRGALAAANDADNLIELAKTNPAAAGAAVRKLARASGDTGVLSDKDVADFGGSKALVDSLERIAVSAADGTMTDTDAAYLQNVASTLKRGAQEKHDAVVEDSVARFTANFGGTYDANYKKLVGKSTPQKGEAKGADKKTESKPTPQAPTKKKISVQAADQIRARPDVQAAFKAGVEKMQAIRAAKGNTQPLTPGEIRAAEIAVWDKLGYAVVPEATP